MVPFFLINGKKSSQLPLDNRALHYGDGLFTTMAVVDGEPLLWAYHWARLCQGAKVLQLALPCEKTCYQAVCDAVVGLADCVVKYLWVRDSSTQTRGYTPVVGKLPVTIIGVYKKPVYPKAYWQQGITVAKIDHPITVSPVLAGIKHLNRLDQVLASGELASQYPNAQEGLCFDMAGNLVSGIKSNVFFIKDAVIYTPTRSLCAVDGIMRRYVMTTLQAMGYQVVETQIKANWLDTADAIFFTNALIGIWPVRNIGTRVYAVPALVRECQMIGFKGEFLSPGIRLRYEMDKMAENNRIVLSTLVDYWHGVCRYVYVFFKLHHYYSPKQVSKVTR